MCCLPTDAEDEAHSTSMTATAAPFSLRELRAKYERRDIPCSRNLKRAGVRRRTCELEVAGRRRRIDHGRDLQHCKPRTESQYQPSFVELTLNPGLLYVCRQIHYESALLPYSLTTFAFKNGSELESFVLHILLETQAAAIQSLQLYGPS